MSAVLYNWRYVRGFKLTKGNGAGVKIEMPEYIAKMLDILEGNGFEAYVVGGCVRDTLLSRVPEDWDIATNAMPDKVKGCFSNYDVLEIGVKHGTVTVVADGNQAEITTFRVDACYSDHRRPDSVEFTRKLESDLERRDFTMNALAYNHRHGLVDFFGGVKDIREKRIVCVGDAKARFFEDSLRIMRAVRFSATLGFTIEKNTAEAMDDLVYLIGGLSPERINSELRKILTGEYISEALQDYTRVFTQILPELKESIGFEQHTRYHHLDVWEHTVEAVKAAPVYLILRLAMLLHDCGKPKCFTLDSDMTGHFYGHADVSAKLADTALTRLRFDNRTKNEVVYLVRHHCDLIKPEQKYLKRMLNKMGEDSLRRLIEIKRADLAAQSPEFRRERSKSLDDIVLLLDEIISQNQAFSLESLAVDGDDLIEIGFHEGKIVGDTLRLLLELVVSDKIENTRDDLINRAKDLLKTVLY